jgi:hypothetical protein
VNAKTMSKKNREQNFIVSLPLLAIHR